MKLFCTVGSTSFDKMILTLTSKDVLDVLERRGYHNLTIQIGSYCGNVEELLTNYNRIFIEYFRYKSSIIDDISDSDLVISHAGAGSCLEVLGLKKPLVVVVNEDLMDNHQTELAQQLNDDGLAYMCTCRTLADTLASVKPNDLKLLPPGEPGLFASFVDHVMSGAA